MITLPQNSKTLFRELDHLKAFYATLAGRLDDAGKQFRKSGVPLPEGLVSELADFNLELKDLGSKVLELGSQLALPEERLSDLPVAALDSLDRSLRRIAQIEERRMTPAAATSEAAAAPGFRSHRDFVGSFMRDEPISNELPGESFSLARSSQTDALEVSSQGLVANNQDVKHAIEQFLLLTASEVESAVMETIKLQRIADLYRDEGKYSLAIPLYTKLIAAQKKLYGPEDPRVSRTCQTLEGLYCIQQANVRPPTNVDQGTLTAAPSRGSRISGAMVFGTVAAVLSYAAIYYWPMNAEALLNYLRPAPSHAASAVPNTALTQAAVQPARATARPKMAFKPRGNAASPKNSTTPNLNEPAQQLAPPHDAPQPAAVIEKESEPAILQN